MTPSLDLFTHSSFDVCLLKRSPYGLKDAARAWFKNFLNILLDFTFIQSQMYSSLFLRKTPTGIVVLLVYADDIVIIGSDLQTVEEVQQQHLRNSFHVKDLDPLQYFLSLEVSTNSIGTLCASA